MPETRRARVLIYARGTAEQIAEQQAQCNEHAERAGEDIVSVASDPPDGCAGWASAQAMLAEGLVDHILVTSRDVTPIAQYVESITRDLRSPLHGRDPERAEPPWRRRPRRLGDVKRRR